MTISRAIALSWVPWDMTDDKWISVDGKGLGLSTNAHQALLTYEQIVHITCRYG